MLIGSKYNRLTVIGLDEATTAADPRHRKVWICKCDCGKTTHLRAYKLVSGHTKSCGCLRADFSDAHRRATSVRTLISVYRSSAKRRNFEWALSEERARELLSGTCGYCGRAPEREFTHGGTVAAISFNGIDRVDSSAGYTSSNTVTCCWTCNRMKGSLSSAEFASAIVAVYAHLQQEDKCQLRPV